MIAAAIDAGLRLRRLAAARAIVAAARDPMRVQHAVLARIVRTNRDTEFGRRHGFEGIRTYADFAARVPIGDYETLRPLVEARIGTGHATLTAEAPVAYARTSGTTGAPKDIPLTAGHLADLRRAQRAAIAFQHRVCPAAFSGALLALTSPAIEGHLADGRPWGSASGMVAACTPRLIRNRFVAPPEVLAIADSRTRYLLVLRLALVRPDLTWLGTANPSTLVALARLYRENAPALIASVAAGGFEPAAALPDGLAALLGDRLRADPARARTLAALHSDGRPVRLRDLFPRLAMVVTWTCASAGVALAALREELDPGTHVQELGYLASELRATVTLGRRAGSGFPTLDTHFFEFAERDAWDRGEREPVTLEALAKGREYYVIATTPSGLYRYFLNDIVRVCGRFHRTPLLAFAQKGKGVTSITGEKVYESQALEAVAGALARAGAVARYVMVLADERAARYRIYVEPGETGAAAAALAPLAADADRGLARLNLEYRAKRESGRLGPPLAAWLAPGTFEAVRAQAVAQGRRDAQFKTVAIDYLDRHAFGLDDRVVAWSERP